VRQPAYDTEDKRKRVRDKVEKVLYNGYIRRSDPTKIRSLMYMFDVPKGDSDVRIIYNGSKSGINDATWAP